MSAGGPAVRTPATDLLPRCGRQALVILDHRGHGPRHQDWLFGNEPRLRTLRLGGRWSVQPAHRPWYRHFQGAVPGARGVVRRRWSGPVLVLRHGGAVLVVAATWRIRLAGSYRITVDSGRITGRLGDCPALGSAMLPPLRRHDLPA